MKLDTLIGEPWADYGLIDSGHGRKLERYGRFRFIRPEPQAMWPPQTPIGARMANLYRDRMRTAVAAGCMLGPCLPMAGRYLGMR